MAVMCLERYCIRDVHARGLCRKHYDEIRRFYICPPNYTWKHLEKIGSSLPTEKEAKERS